MALRYNFCRQQRHILFNILSLNKEENDIDEMMNVPLFERVPGLEEPHLRQMIPQMKDKGLDTSEVESRLKELVEKRLTKEQDKR